MNSKNIIWSTIIVIVISSISYFAYKTTKRQKEELFKIAKFEKRDITQIINTTGSIEAENTVKVGSLINGVVKNLYVEENERVKKGQLIALLDNGKGDTDVKRTLGLVKTSEADVKYLKDFLNRQKLMFDKGHISKNTLELAQRQYYQARGILEERKAAHEKAFIDYENTKILSPINGIIIKKNVSLGQGVSSFLMPTVLYIIAQDLTKMKIELEVDEASIGDLRIGAQAIITFDTYPNKEFRGKIKEISNGPIVSKGTVSYKAYIYIDNKHLLLKPGMTVHADILVAQKKDIFAIPGYILAINPKLIKFVAEKREYGYEPLTPEKMIAFKKLIKNEENLIKTVWIFKNKAFVEKPIELGITDKIFFEIVTGLKITENILIDVEETDVMKQMFKKILGGGMSK